MQIRTAQPADLPDILQAYAHARDFMRKTGNPDQWRDFHPAESLLREDIARQTLYVMIQNGILAGVFALLTGDDPTYAYIKGSWRNSQPYVTIHRIASSGAAHGILACAVDFALQQCNNVRIDTHHDNKVMQHLLTKLGFAQCGIIYLANGEPRIAYQLET